jgi:LPXTG-site transpeptidase (sortase) family protein
MKRLQRPALFALLFVGLAMALWPAGERVYGWWSQQALHAAWHGAAREAQTREDTTNQEQAEKTPVKNVALTPATKPAINSTGTPVKTTKPLAARKAAAGSGKVRNGIPGQKKKPAAQSRRWVPMRLRIPDINVDTIVVQGISNAMLRQGPGHDSSSSLPGASGNCIIAAHRNAYGWWFHGLDKLEHGSVIQIETPRELFTYRVILKTIAEETDFSWLQQTPTPRLTLYTCTLPKSAQRVLVAADLETRSPSY